MKFVKGGAAGEVKSEINVTPLVDVCLVLLIIFMVITPLLQSGVSVKLPAAKNTYKPENGGKPIVVAVSADGLVHVEEDVVEMDKLTERMEHEVRYNPGQRILLKGDRTLEYGKVREVLEHVQKAGAVGVSLATEQLKEKKGEGPGHPEGEAAPEGEGR